MSKLIVVGHTCPEDFADFSSPAEDEAVQRMEQAIEAGRSKKGGWKRTQFAKWGLPWPPQKGWKQELIERARAEARRSTQASGRE